MSFTLDYKRHAICPVGDLLSIAGPDLIAKQSVANEEGIRRNALGPSFDQPLTTDIPGNSAKTIYELFENTLKRVPDLPFLGERSTGEYLWKTYREVANMRDWLGSGFIQLGAQPGAHIAVYSKNRPEWVLAELASASYSMASIGLYDALGSDMVQYVTSHAECPILIVSGDKVEPVVRVAEQCTHLKHVISMEPVSEQHVELANKAGIELHTFDAVLDLGKKNPSAHVTPSPESEYCIVYTSGSTGVPKGVLIEHNRAIAVIGAMYNTDTRPMMDEEVHLSYLPLAHVAEKMTYSLVMSAGGRVGFFGGFNPKLLEDIQLLRPTFIIGAPRVYQRVKDKISQALNKKWTTRWLFAIGYRAKKAAIANGSTSPFWDMLLMKKLNAKLGGRVRFCISASAPLDTEVAEFIEVALCCPVVQGYGLSETFGPATLGYLADMPISDIQCGSPLSCVEFKLQDASDAGYSLQDKPYPRGEILIRGPGVFSGYYKAETDCLDSEGWLHTGDVGLYNDRGSLQVIDRLKNIFKLSQGEFVPAETVEAILCRSAYVQQAYVSSGVLSSSFIVAIIVLDPDTVVPLAQSLGLSLPNGESECMEVICGSEQIHDIVLQDIHTMQVNAKLARYLMIRDIIFEPYPFTVDNDLLTPTFKIRRVQVKAKYEKDLAELHGQINA